MRIAATHSPIDMRNPRRGARQVLFVLCAVLLCGCIFSDGARISKSAPAAPVAAHALVDTPIAVTPLAAPGAVILPAQATPVAVAGAATPVAPTPPVAKYVPPPQNPRGTAATTADLAPASDVPIVAQEPLSPQALACRKKGKTWDDAGSQGAKACISQTGEAGKSCSSGNDCIGFCLARSRTCAPYTPLFGCNDILQDDGQKVTLCLD